MQTSGAITGRIENKNYHVARLNADNLRDLEQLHHAVYGRPSAKGYYFNKYNTAYTGKRYVGFIAYNATGTPVAYYGVLPCYLKHGDTIMLAAQSADTMTHPM